MRAFLLCLLLAACASLDQVGSEPPKNPNYVKDECGYVWSLENKPIAESRWTYFRTDDVVFHCGNEHNALSCSKRRQEGCEIVLPKKPVAGDFCHSLEYLKRHEELHCMGWVHPGGLEG